GDGKSRRRRRQSVAAAKPWDDHLSSLLRPEHHRLWRPRDLLRLHIDRHRGDPGWRRALRLAWRWAVQRCRGNLAQRRPRRNRDIWDGWRGRDIDQFKPGRQLLERLRPNPRHVKEARVYGLPGRPRERSAHIDGPAHDHREAEAEGGEL